MAFKVKQRPKCTGSSRGGGPAFPLRGLSARPRFPCAPGSRGNHTDGDALPGAPVLSRSRTGPEGLHRTLRGRNRCVHSGSNSGWTTQCLDDSSPAEPDHARLYEATLRPQRLTGGIVPRSFPAGLHAGDVCVGAIGKVGCTCSAVLATQGLQCEVIRPSGGTSPCLCTPIMPENPEKKHKWPSVCPPSSDTLRPPNLQPQAPWVKCLRSQTSESQSLTLLLSSCVTLKKWLNLSEFRVPSFSRKKCP